MPDRREKTRVEDARVRVILTLSPEQAGRVDALRGEIPLATWCRDAVVRAVGDMERARGGRS